MIVWLVVPTYGAPDLLARCLESIAAQDDPDFRVFVSEDGSHDQQVAHVLNGYEGREGWTIIRRRKNLGALANIVSTVRTIQTTETMDPSDVILLVDGDDRMADESSIRTIREAFTDDVDFAYGGYVSDPPDDGCPPALPLPPDVLRFGLVRSFTRDVGAWVNHPLAFRRRVFDVLREDDFLGPDGEVMRYAYDTALAMPMLEAAGPHVAFLDTVTYVYSSARPDSVARAHAEAANRENEWVLSRPRKYEPVEVWPEYVPDLDSADD